MATAQETINALFSVPGNVGGTVGRQAATGAQRQIDDLFKTPEQRKREEEEERQRLLQQQAEETGSLDAFLVQAGGGTERLLEGAQQIFFGAQQKANEQSINSIKKQIELGNIPEAQGQARIGELEQEQQDFAVKLEDLKQQGLQREELLAPLSEESPIASFAGQVFNPAIGIATATKTGGAAIGAIEGALQPAESGEQRLKNIATGAGFGLGGQVVGDFLGEIVTSTFRGFTGKAPPTALTDSSGNFTDEAKKFFKENNIDPDQFGTDSANKFLFQSPEGLESQAAIRAAEIAEVTGETPTLGQVTRNTEQLQNEYNLFRDKQSGAGQKLTSHLDAQNKGLIERGKKIIDDLGGDSRQSSSNAKAIAGANVQDLLRTSKDARRAKVNELYKTAEDLTGTQLPVSQQNIISQYGDSLQDFGDAVPKQVQNLLEEFSVLPPTSDVLERRVQKLIDGGLSPEQAQASVRLPKPLTVGTANELRKRINALIPANDPVVQRATIPILDSIDRALDDIALPNDIGEQAGADAVQAFQKARAEARALNKEFSQKDIIQEITSFKPGTETDIVSPGAVVDQILTKKNRVTNISKIKTSLDKLGTPGQERWNELRSGIMLEILGKANRNGSTNAGDRIFSGRRLNNELDAIGDPALKVLFDENERGILRQLARVGESVNTIESGIFTPSGAQAQNVVNKLIDRLAISQVFRKTPGGTALAAGIVAGKRAAELTGEQLDLNRALNPTIALGPIAAQKLGSLSPDARDFLRVFNLMTTGREATIQAGIGPETEAEQ